MEKINKREINKGYKEIMIPVLLGAAGMGLYYFSDGLFVGNAMGDDGMSAITISWTIVNLLVAIATGIGVGGSIRYSVSLGRKQEQEANRYLLGTIGLLLLTSILFTIILSFCFQDILKLLGASGNVLKLSIEYSRLVSYGVVFQIFGIGALPLVRNMGEHRLASIAMGTGYIMNVILDYILMVVIPMGMLGCSIAYISGQIIVTIPCALFLIGIIKEKKLHVFSLAWMSKKMLVSIFVTGMAPFGLYFSQNLVAMLLNKQFMVIGGSEALASYTVVIYIAGITNNLHRAIMDGSQPLISQFFGARKMKLSHHIAKLMYTLSAILILFGSIVTLLFKYQVANLFGVSEEVAEISVKWLPLYLLGYAFVCFSRTTITYFSSIDQNIKATLLTYAEPIIIILAITILPLWLYIAGVWIGLIGAYLIMALLAVIALLLDNISSKLNSALNLSSIRKSKK